MGYILSNKVKTAKESLNYLRDRYILEHGTLLEEVNNTIEQLIIELCSYNNGPKFVVTRALYEGSDGSIESGRFVIRPSIQYTLDVKDMKRVFTIVGDKDFYNTFIDNVINWFDDYTYYVALGVHIEKLNYEIERIRKKSNIPNKLRFTIGEGIKDIDNSNIELGLSNEVAENIMRLPLFSEDEIWRGNYEIELRNILKECGCPYDIIKIKHPITQDLGIYSRKSISKMIRNIVSRRIGHVRVGVGYYEDNDIFAVIEKRAIQEEGIKNYLGYEILVEDNSYMTGREKKENLKKIVTYYKVAPFCKKTGIPVDVPLAEIMKKGGL